MNVKIGPREYVIRKPSEIVEIGGDYYGRCYAKDCAIDIAGRFDAITQGETFIHELIHAICYDRCLSELDSNEQWVDSLAKGFYAVIKNNPHIFTMNDI